MSKLETCINCRARKVKCDGEYPKCGPCSRSRRMLTCAYDPSRRERINKLHKRGACYPCRQKKRRCDAVRPSCGPCQTSNIEHECVYEAVNMPYPIISSHSSQAIENEARSPLYDESLTSHTSSASQAVTPLSGSSSASYLVWHTSPSSSDSSSEISSSCPASLEVLLPSDRLTNPTPDKPSYFPLSYVSLDDLNMKLLIFLTKQFFHGMYLSFRSKQAIFEGDLSGETVHPFFVHLAHLIGCQLYQEIAGSYGFLSIQASHYSATVETFEDMKEEDDPVSLAWANLILGSVYGYTHRLHESKIHVRKSIDIVKRNNIRFVSVSVDDTDSQLGPNFSSQIPELSDEVYDRAAFLGHMLYGQVWCYLAGQPAAEPVFNFEQDLTDVLPKLYADRYLDVVDGQPRELSSDLEKQFRYDLPEAYPTLFQICPIIPQVRSLILTKDGENMITWYHQQETLPPLWLTTCRIFLFHLTSHIDALKALVAYCTAANERDAGVSLRLSSIINLTTLAKITSLLDEIPSPQSVFVAEFRGKCQEALERIVTIAEEFAPDDFRLLDPMLGMVWAQLLSFFSCKIQPPSSTSVNPPSTIVSVASPLQSHAEATSYPTSSENSGGFKPTKNNSNISFSLSRIAQLNEKFIQNRFLPGTEHLCQLIAGEITRRPGHTCG